MNKNRLKIEDMIIGETYYIVGKKAILRKKYKKHNSFPVEHTLVFEIKKPNYPFYTNKKGIYLFTFEIIKNAITKTK